MSSNASIWTKQGIQAHDTSQYHDFYTNPLAESDQASASHIRIFTLVKHKGFEHWNPEWALSLTQRAHDRDTTVIMCRAQCLTQCLATSGTAVDSFRHDYLE